MSNVPWHIREGRVLHPSPFALMGIVNVTPDSFYDGGIHIDSGAAIMHALALIEQGACVVDIGGESTRPQAIPVSEREEWERIEPVITGILAKNPAAIISVDTKKTFVAAKALLAGAHVINDVSACLFDTALLELVGAMKPGYVLMHNTGLAGNTLQLAPKQKLEHVLLTFFETQMTRLVQAGLPESHIMLDPGIGFGTNPELALRMLQIVPCLGVLGRPVLVGLSMKSFLGYLFDVSVHERAEWTRLATVLLVQQGIVWHRVHEVALCVKALRFAESLRYDVDGTV